MPSFPKRLAGYKLDAPDEPVELTDISYTHRQNNLRATEEEYQDKHGDLFQCPTCRKHAYTSIEGGSDSPDCDSCWSFSQNAGLPKAKWAQQNKPVIANQPDEFWNESNYKSKEYGLHYCGQEKEDGTGTCNYMAESRWGLEDHWENDPEHKPDERNR